MDSNIFKILQELQPTGVGKFFDLCPLLIKLFPDVDKTNQFSIREEWQSILRLLDSMKSKGYIKTNAYPYIPTDKWIEGIPIMASIEPDGLSALENEISKGSEERLRESLIDTNTSIQDTNASFKKLNTTVIPNNNRLQRNMSYLTLTVAALSLIAIAFSAYYSSQGVTSENIKSLNMQLQDNTKLLEKMQQSQKGIDSSLQIMVKKDSLIKK